MRPAQRIVDLSRGIPAFLQIADHVRDALARGDLHPGDALPTIHAMAELADVNPNTVVRAYRELAEDGLIDSLPGRGTFLRAPPAGDKASHVAAMDEVADLVLREVVSRGLDRGRLARHLHQRLTGRPAKEQP